MYRAKKSSKRRVEFVELDPSVINDGISKSTNRIHRFSARSQPFVSR